MRINQGKEHRAYCFRRAIRIFDMVALSKDMLEESE